MSKLPGIDLFFLRFYGGQEGGGHVRFSLSWMAGSGWSRHEITNRTMRHRDRETGGAHSLLRQVFKV